MKNIAGSKHNRLWVHTIIIAVFILYCVFIADPLFKIIDNMVLVPEQFEITETNDINYSISGIAIHKDLLQISGWAYIENRDTNGNKIYIVLKSKEHRYIFNTTPEDRPDVTQKWANSETNLNNSGLTLTLPCNQLETGTYIVGIYISKNEIRALEYIDRAVKIAGNQCTEVPRLSEMETIALPAATDDIVCDMDTIEYNADDNYLEIKGYAFIKGVDSVGSFINVVLQSNTGRYVFNAIPLTINNVTQIFGKDKLNLVNSGFIARLAADQIEDDEYRIAIYISKNNVTRLQQTSEAIVKQNNQIARLVELEWQGGFSVLEGTVENNWRWCSSQGTLIIDNHSNKDREFVISATFYTGYPAWSDLRMESDLLSENLQINDRGYAYEEEIIIPPGDHSINFNCDAGRIILPSDSADLRVLVFSTGNFNILPREWLQEYAHTATEWKGGFSLPEGTEANNWRWCSSKGTLILTNSSPETKKYVISATFFTGYPEMADLKVESAMFKESLKINSSENDFKKEIAVSPGSHIINFSCNAKRVDAPDDPRYLVFGVRNFQMEVSK